MEALSATAPLVLVLRGAIMGALASATAPGPLPHPQAPAQTKFERADARVEIVEPIAIGFRLLFGSQDRDVTIDGYRIPVRRRLGAGQQVSEQPVAAQFVADLP
jgi:hypothetical protein